MMSVCDTEIDQTNKLTGILHCIVFVYMMSVCDTEINQSNKQINMHFTFDSNCLYDVIM